MRVIVGTMCAFVGFVIGLAVSTPLERPVQPITIKPACPDEPEKVIDALLRNGWKLDRHPSTRSEP